MNKYEIIIKNELNSTAADNDRKGDIIYNKINDIISSGGGEIILDFIGINIINTAFLNNAIGELYSIKDWSAKNFEIQLVNFSQDTLDLIREVINSAREKYRV